MKIIVTGGAGFIGSHIVDACLKSGHEIEIIDDLSSGSSENVPHDVPLHQVDIRNTVSVTKLFQHFNLMLCVTRQPNYPLVDLFVSLC